MSDNVVRFPVEKRKHQMITENDIFVRTCPECHRKFDMTNEDDAAEWSYGHDCE
jgi:hypothetical protein